MLNIRLLYISALLVFVVNGSACRRHSKPFALDEGKLPQINLTLKDYGRALFETDTTVFVEQLRVMQAEYSPFLNGSLDDSAGVNRLKKFVSDSLARRMYQKTLAVFGQDDAWKQMLNISFRRFKHYFPSIPLPIIYTYISNVQFEQPVLVGPNELLIALDCFLGADEPDYARLGIPRYMTARMTPSHLGATLWKAMYEAHIEDLVIRTRVLDEMIASGRKYLFIETMLPDVSDHIIFGIEKEKMQWLQQHESEVWTALVSGELLYSSDPVVFRKLFADGPFSADFSPEAPARIGEWIGWQIMRSYARQHAEKSLTAVLHPIDAQSVLSQSRYKPKK